MWARIGSGRRLAEPALSLLTGYDWPGNMRQLVSCLRTLAALSEPGGEVGIDALPAYLRQPPAGGRVEPVRMPAAALDALELAAMRAAVEACDGNVAKAARRLGVSRSTLYRRLGGDVRRPA